MNDGATMETVTEAVGLFHTAKEMQAAIDRLLEHGFDRADVSVLASEKAIAEKLGDRYRSVHDLEDDPYVPTTAFVPRESIGGAEGAVIGVLMYIPAAIGGLAVVASGGTLAAAVAALAISGTIGASVGTLLAALVGHNYAQEIEDHLKQGGLLLWVRTRDKEHEARATGILKEMGAGDVHLHVLPSLRRRH